MADRDRQYRLHQEALRRIQGTKGPPIHASAGRRAPYYASKPRADQADAERIPSEQIQSTGKSIIDQDPLPSGAEAEGRRGPPRFKPLQYTYGFETTIAELNGQAGSKRPVPQQCEA
jgi:hypothetical protein